MKRQSPFQMPDGRVLGRSGQYVMANGVRLYYEVHGEGEPLILLHGDFGNVESLYTMIPELMKHFQCFVPDRRGHGRSNDPPGAPYSYELFAEDVREFMTILGLKRAHVVGFSGGATAGLCLGVDSPEMVEKLVCIGSGFSIAGSRYDTLKKAAALTPRDLGPEIVVSWKKNSPEGSLHFPAFFQKMKNLWISSPAYTPEDLAKVTAPTLVMVGDKDYVTVEHALLFAESVAEGRLFVISGSHFIPLEKPHLVNAIVLDFLKEEVAVQRDMREERTRAKCT